MTSGPKPVLPVAQIAGRAPVPAERAAPHPQPRVLEGELLLERGPDPLRASAPIPAPSPRFNVLPIHRGAADPRTVRAAYQANAHLSAPRRQLDLSA